MGRSRLAALSLGCAMAVVSAAPVVTAATLGTVAVAASPSADDRPTTGSAQPVGTNSLVSVRPDGRMAGSYNETAVVDGTGRYVAFTSLAKGLVPGSGPTRGRRHGYLRDRLTGMTAVVDVRRNGKFGNGSTQVQSMSADGRLVTFASDATNLDRGGYKRGYDVFVRDVVAGTTTIVPRALDGGRPDGGSGASDISADGSTLTFSSTARNLVPDGPGYRYNHIYSQDLATGVISLVSKTPAGEFPNSYCSLPSISGDGKVITYETYADDIAGGNHLASKIVAYDAEADASILVNQSYNDDPASGAAFRPSVSADGETIVYSSWADNLVPDDTNGVDDIFAYDLVTDTNSLISRSRTGGPANGPSDGTSDVSSDGRYVTFLSDATNIVAGDHNAWGDAFVRDTLDGTTRAITRAPDGASSDSSTVGTAIAGDGSLVAYSSYATNLVPDPPFGYAQIYAYRVW